MRQLHLYSFKIVKNADRSVEYRNPQFQRGQYCELPQLKKKIGKKLRISKVSSHNVDITAEHTALQSKIYNMEESVKRVSEHTAALTNKNQNMIKQLLQEQHDYSSLVKSTLYSFSAIISSLQLQQQNSAIYPNFSSFINQECTYCNFYKQDFSRFCASNLSKPSTALAKQNAHACAEHISLALANQNYEGVLGTVTNCAFNAFCFTDDSCEQREALRDAINAQVREYAQIVGGGGKQVPCAVDAHGEDDTIADAQSRKSCIEAIVCNETAVGGVSTRLHTEPSTRRKI